MFSKNLRFYRLKSGMSMKQLASLVGVSAMTISYYESGERKPGREADYYYRQPRTPGGGGDSGLGFVGNGSH